MTYIRYMNKFKISFLEVYSVVYMLCIDQGRNSKCTGRVCLIKQIITSICRRWNYVHDNLKMLKKIADQKTQYSEMCTVLSTVGGFHAQTMMIKDDRQVCLLYIIHLSCNLFYKWILTQDRSWLIHWSYLKINTISFISVLTVSKIFKVHVQ